MQFAIVLLLVVAGILSLQWSFLLGALLIGAGVALHSRIDRWSEDRFFGLLFCLAAIGVIVEVGADLGPRIFG